MRVLTKHSSKTGFSLLEMIIVIAILVIVSVFIFSSFFVVSRSHARVLLLNDAKDFCAVHTKAAANLLTNADSVHIVGIGSDLSSPPGPGYHLLIPSSDRTKLEYDGSVLLNYEQLKTSDGIDKWAMNIEYFKINDNAVRVHLELYENKTGESVYAITEDVLVINAPPADEDGNGIIDPGGTTPAERLAVWIRYPDFSTLP